MLIIIHIKVITVYLGEKKVKQIIIPHVQENNGDNKNSNLV